MRDRIFIVLAATFGVLLFGIGCATIAMTMQYGVSGAFAVMGRNVPWMPYLAPFGVLLLAWLVVDGLTSRESL